MSDELELEPASAPDSPPPVEPVFELEELSPEEISTNSKYRSTAQRFASKKKMVRRKAPPRPEPTATAPEKPVVVVEDEPTPEELAAMAKDRRRLTGGLPIIIAALIIAAIAYLAFLFADRNRAQSFRRLMADGEAHLQDGLLDQAEVFYRDARSIKGYEDSDEITQALRRVRQARAAEIYDKQLKAAATALANHDYAVALGIYEDALKIPNYAGDYVAAQAGLAQTRVLVQQEHDENFARDFNAGVLALRQNKVIEAKMLFQRARSFAGHDHDPKLDPYMRLLTTQIDERAAMSVDAAYQAQLREGYAALEAKNFAGAIKAFQAAIATGYENPAAAQDGLAKAEAENATANRAAIYREHLKIAEAALAQNNYDVAAKEYAAALAVAGYAADETAQKGLARAQRQSAVDAAAAPYREKMQEGEAYLRARRFVDAEKSFQEALMLAGHEEDAAAQAQLQIAQTGKENASRYSRLLMDGKGELARRKFAAAEEQIRAALAVPGYADDAEAKKYLAQAQDALARAQKKANAAKKKK
ncbi:hypothetical protein FACS1894139_16450 [Planctomycetales bacterium]|nr:hypothetical protein FACS1894139_16450 [Planctomycetales bacterium]